METMSFSVDKETKQQIAKLAKQQKKSKSDVFRDVWSNYLFSQSLNHSQNLAWEKLLELGLETEDDFERYLD